MQLINPSVNNIYDLIEFLRIRPAMYIGDSKLSTLSSFLSGYELALHFHNIKIEEVFPPFWYFHEWAMHQYDWFESTAGWKNIILQENDFDEEKAMKVFFEMIDEFKTLHPLSIWRAEITPLNLEFHHSQRRITNYMNEETIVEKPVYDEVFLVKFSHNFGFSYFLRNKNVLEEFAWRDRFKKIKLAKDKINRLFGHQTDWKLLTGDLQKTIEQLVKNKAIKS